MSKIINYSLYSFSIVNTCVFVFVRQCDCTTAEYDY
jgi:hypothetical protein